MADASSLSAVVKAETETPESEGPTKKQKKDVPDFKDPKSMITLILTDDDDENTEFLVHKEAIFHHCAVIKAAIQTSRSAHYHLSNTTPGAVRFLLQWLYSQRITVRQIDGGLKINDDEYRTGAAECQEEDFALIELWALAQELKLPRLQNLALRAIDDVYHECQKVNAFCITRVYNITTTGCKLREYYVALCVRGRVMHTRDSWSTEILSDMLNHAYKNLNEHCFPNVAAFFCELEEL